jgi:glycosyltransferase involved in cell wall biosynthesis
LETDALVRMESKGQGASGSSAPLVSVVIPTYNRADFLAAAVDSVLKQSYPNIEAIVVDDGSTDATARVMEGYRGRVTFLRQANAGIARARNAGLQAAHGKYVAFIDSDDECEPARIAIQVACLESFPDVVMCCSDFSAFDSGGFIESSHIGAYYSHVRRTPGGAPALFPESTRLKREQLPGQKVAVPPSVPVYMGNVYESLMWGSFVHPPTIMVRAATLNEDGTFESSIPISTEYDWIIRMSRRGKVAYVACP